MPIVASLKDGVRRRIERSQTYRTELMNYDAPALSKTPNCKLVEQDGDSTLGAHFHCVNQFQIFVAGSGAIGKMPARPVTVQYAAAYTPYGPLVAAAEGLSYFVVRDAIDTGAAFMPQEREKLKPVPRRSRVGSPVAPELEAALPGCITAIDLLRAEDDGLHTTLARVGPGTVFAGSAPSEGGGQFHLLISGSMTHEGVELFPLASVYVGSDEPPVRLEAGAAGAEIVSLQFPRG